MKYLNLIRWKNLLMIALVQLLIKFALLEPFNVSTSLDGLGFLLLILATICIAAAGNVINDICDINTDFINKPDKLIVNKSISEQTAYNLFIAFNVIGVGLGYYLSFSIGKSGFFAIFVIISVLLYIYATYLKQLFLIGNIIVSVLVACSILIVGLFDILPAITATNQSTQLFFFKILFNYALFAFVINLLREIAKDIEDLEGDQKTGMHTLPIVMGQQTTTYILFGLTITSTIVFFFYILDSLYKNTFVSLYFITLIIGPMLYTSIKIFMANSKKDFRHISNLFKIIMLFGMLSLLLYKYMLIK
ncbi:geranylgeranylglycerol-phosphate geranylgeranyltransferase [Aestuariibaculum marinum]|uniref:Geranylgeranylglycerol-phosphate geranylgeranyltransferase n=1 Tax=Aestuariibaculum marinum TaxID=2683592 RepID=A0A8J6PN12_9FLAO|nr:geranylgeranylglycerol-phosphate geranylgeranyltransferase [Aestuariibaculum marinum]MBD0822440.1 geranylgeranylglycerol-phosphate geranylgeranyltransferase [Aestuariibaculum marinum]